MYDLRHRHVRDGLRRYPAHLSRVFVAQGGEAVCAFVLEDRVREDAAKSLGQLRAMGHRLVLLSGDSEPTVKGVAGQLSRSDRDVFVDVQGASSPEAKLGYVENLKAQGRTVVMVGDGINDAAALAAAHVGVAVSGAAEASQMSADVFLPAPGVAELTDLMSGSSRVLGTIRRGLGFSLAYNVLGIGLAVFGILGPLGAAILMPLSSLTVVTHAFRSRSFSQGGAV